LPGLSELLSEAPGDQRSLLELGVRWPTLPEAHARVAATLRVFVLNWDPLGWLGQAFEASATATGDGDDFELVLYAPVDDPPGLLDDRCRSVVDVGVSQELLLRSGAYAQLAFAGKAPDLLCAIGTLSVTGAPEFEAARGGWEPPRVSPRHLDPCPRRRCPSIARRPRPGGARAAARLSAGGGSGRPAGRGDRRRAPVRSSRDPPGPRVPTLLRLQRSRSVPTEPGPGSASRPRSAATLRARAAAGASTRSAAGRDLVRARLALISV
jgi:hypothetical protein